MQLSHQKDKKTLCKMTTTDDQKKEVLFKKIIANDIEGLKTLNLNSLDLNIMEPVQALFFVDQCVTPLIYCSYFGKTQIAKLLLSNPMIDVDLHTPNNRQTPLIAACMGGNYEMVKLLLDHQAQVNKPNAFNQNPLVSIVNRLIEEGDSFENRCICFKIAGILASNGADLNWVLDKVRGFTLLHYLCASTHKLKKEEKQLNYDLIKFLIDRGANVNQRSLDDRLPQDLAIKHCNATAIIDLINKSKQKTPESARPRASSTLIPKKKQNSILRQYFEQKTQLGVFQDSKQERCSSKDKGNWNLLSGCMSKKNKK